MMNALISLGLGIIIFALIAGVGVVVLTNFGSVGANCYIASCGDGTYNTSTDVCSNLTSSDCGDPSNTVWTNNHTMIGYVNSNLVTWIPAVIALGIGLLFIGALMGKKGREY
jgi:hypothetical protein